MAVTNITHRILTYNIKVKNVHTDDAMTETSTDTADRQRYLQSRKTAFNVNDTGVDASVSVEMLMLQ